MFLYALRFAVIGSISATLLVLSLACITRVTPEPDAAPLIGVEETIEAAVAATLTAMPTPTPVPTPTQVPTRTPRPTPTPTAIPEPTPMPTATPAPVPAPLEATFRRISSSNGGTPPEFQVRLKNLTERVIQEYGLEICPLDRGGQPVPDRDSGERCFVVSGESTFQPVNARPPTGYVLVLEGLYEKVEGDTTLQWGTSHYPSWVGTGYEAASQARVTLTYARFQNGEVWENGRLIPPGSN